MVDCCATQHGYLKSIKKMSFLFLEIIPIMLSVKLQCTNLKSISAGKHQETLITVCLHYSTDCSFFMCFLRPALHINLFHSKPSQPCNLSFIRVALSISPLQLTEKLRGTCGELHQFETGSFSFLQQGPCNNYSEHSLMPHLSD